MPDSLLSLQEIVSSNLKEYSVWSYARKSRNTFNVKILLILNDGTIKRRYLEIIVTSLWLSSKSTWIGICIFRTLCNIYDGNICEKKQQLKAIHFFGKTQSQMFFGALNTSLARELFFHYKTNGCGVDDGIII